MRKGSILFILIIGIFLVSGASATNYTWDGSTGNWLDANYWNPAGFSNSIDDNALINSGVAQTGTSSSTFNTNLTLESGGVIEAPAVNARTWTVRYLIFGGGTILWLGGNSKWAGTIHARENTTSILDVRGTYGQKSYSWILEGNGTINKTGSNYWKLTTSSANFGGTLNINEGKMIIRSRTHSFGNSQGKIAIYNGGVLEEGSSSATWTFAGGLYLKGGQILESGNNGAIFTSSTTVHVLDNSEIKVNGPSSGKRPYLRLDGSLNGTGNLSIDTTNNNRGVSLRGIGNYSGIITLENQSYLYIGNSNALSENASIVLNGDNSDMSLLTIGGYKTKDTLTNVNNVNLTVRNLIINGTKIASGYYDSTNQNQLKGYVVFNNALSSIYVVEGDLTPPNINISYPENITYNYSVDEFNYSYSDINPGYCWYSNNSGITNSTPVSAGTNFVNMSTVEGSNGWTLYCNDTEGNLNQTSITFIIDLTEPNATILNPSNGTETNNALQNFTLNMSDNIGLKNATLYIYNNTGLYNQTTIDVTGTSAEKGIVVWLDDGIYNWFWKVFDSGGNYFSTQEDKGNYTATVDTTPPSIVNISYSPNYSGDVDPWQNITFNVSVNDSGVGVDSVILQTYNGTDWANTTMNLISGERYSATVTLSGVETNYTYNVWANDSLGNSNHSINETFESMWDCTWNITSADLGATAGFNKNKQIGNITIVNTGDSEYSVGSCELTFRLTYNLDEGRIYFDNEYFKPSNTYTINAKENQTISVNGTFLSEVKEEDAVITINEVLGRTGTESRNVSATIVSTTDSGPYLYEKIESAENEIYLTPTDGAFSATLQNLMGNGSDTTTAYNVTFNWTLPEGFLLKDGNQNLFFQNISNKSAITNSINITFNSDNLPSLSPGEYTMYIYAQGYNMSGDLIRHSENRTLLVKSTNVTLSCYSGKDGIYVSACGEDDGDYVPSPHFGGGGRGSSTITKPTSQSKVYTEGVEMVRKEKNSFEIEIKNREGGKTLENIKLQIAGYPTQYLSISPEVIDKLEYGEAKNFTITLGAPSYESYQEMELKAFVSGSLRDSNDFAISYNEVHNIKLIIQEISREESYGQIKNAEKAIENLKEKGIYVKELERLFEMANEKLAMKRNKDAYNLASEIINKEKTALRAYEIIEKLKQEVRVGFGSSGKISGMAISNSATNGDSINSLLNLAVAAFERGDYETALERAKKAEVLLALEREGSIKWFIYQNWKFMILAALASVVLFIMAHRIYKKQVINEKITDLEKESREIRGFMAKNQKGYYKGKIGPETFEMMKEQYEKRQAQIDKEIETLRSKRANILKEEDELKELNLEAKKVKEKIKKIQQDYYLKGKLSESEYKGQYNMLNNRMAEIEEERATAHILALKKKEQGKIKTYPEIKRKSVKQKENRVEEALTKTGFKLKVLTNKIKEKRHKHGK